MATHHNRDRYRSYCRTFFAWSCSVMPGLFIVPDSTFLASMQAMNRAIQNPLFFSCFFGVAILLPISTFLSGPASYWQLLAASVVYWTGVMGITIFGNVPLNNRLEASPLEAASSREMDKLRMLFEKRWTRLNHIRTLSSVIAFVLVLTAVLYS